MKITCAWCGNDIGEKDGEGIEGASHGICEECFSKLKAKAGEGSSVESAENTQGE